MSSTASRLLIPLRIQGIFYNSLPLIAVLLSAGFAFVSNQQRERTELSLNRHFEMVENLVEIGSTLLNASAGLRGLLLTQDRSFLDPYTRATELLPQKLARLRTLMQSIPKENRRLEKLAALDAIEPQLNAEMEALGVLSAPWAQSPPVSLPPVGEVSAEIQRNQPQLQAVCARLDDLRGSEQHLLTRRIDEIRAARQRDYLLIVISLLVGLGSRAIALYFFHRRVIRRVRQLTENVRSLRDGNGPVHQPSGHADEIGELEDELALVSEFFAGRR
jgi:CHASE3 domain sensor protein